MRLLEWFLGVLVFFWGFFRFGEFGSPLDESVGIWLSAGGSEVVIGWGWVGGCCCWREVLYVEWSPGASSVIPFDFR